MRENIGSDDGIEDVPMESDQNTIEGAGDVEVIRLDPETSNALEEAIDEEASDEEVGPLDESIKKLKPHAKDGFCVSCSENWIATGGEDDVAVVFRRDLSEDQPVLTVRNHKDTVVSVRFNSSSSMLATADMLGRIVITNLSNGSELCKMDDCDDLEWMDWHFAADILFAGGGGGIIWIYLISSSGIAQTKTLVSNVNAPCTVGKLLRDGKRLIAGYGDGTIIIWSIKDSVAKIVAQASDSQCTTADEHSRFNWAAVGMDNGKCLFINTKSGLVINDLLLQSETKEEPVKEGEMPKTMESIECVSFCPNEEPWVVVATNGGMLGIYDVSRSISPRHIISHDGQTVVKILWCSGGNTVISACLDGCLRFWDTRNGSLLKCLSGGAEEIYDFTVFSNFIYSVSANGHLRVFQI